MFCVELIGRTKGFSIFFAILRCILGFKETSKSPEIPPTEAPVGATSTSSI